MKRFLHWIWVVVFAGCQMLADAQNDSVPFLYRGHLYLHATVNDTVNMLYLRRYEPDSARKATYDYSFRNRTDINAGWLVSALYRDGDAANAGMALGDTIKAVNGRPVADYSWEEEYNLFDTPKLVLDIVGTNGEEKRIELEAKEMW